MSSDERAGAVLVGGIALVIVFLLLVFNSFVVVKSGYVGVITTFSKVTGERQPGVSLKWPLAQGVTGMNVQVQKEQQDASAATQDLQTVTAKIALNYHLDHSQVSNVFTNLSADYVDRVISPDIQETVKAVTAQYNAEDLLTERAAVADAMTKFLIQKLQPRGIVVDQVSIVDFAFSKEFSAAIEGKVVSAQNVLKAENDLKTAQITAQSNQAQQAALTDQILEQQAIAKWNGVLPATVAGQGSVFNIPLNK